MLKQLLDEKVHLQKHLFEKGFLITDAAIEDTEGYPFYGNWDRETVGKFDFLIYKTVKRYFVSSSVGTFFLIGHAFNPFTMTADETAILERIASVYDTPAYYDAIDELTGVFIMGVVRGDALEFLLDASGMQYGCYGRVDGHVYVTSHMRLIGDLRGLEEDPYVTRLIHYRWYRYMMGNYIAGDGTCYREIKRIVPNTAVSYDDGRFTVTRFYPRRALDMCETEEAYQSVIREAAEIMMNTMKLIPEKWERPSISLTGGVDSNTTFAAANGVYDRYSTFSYIAMHRESVDAEKAREISDRFGLKHTVYEIPEDNAAIADFEAYKLIFSYNGGDIGPSRDNDVRKKAYLLQCDIGDVEVKSWVSETIRAYAYKYFGRKRFPKSLKPRNYTSLYKIFFMNRKLVWETDRRFTAYLKDTCLKEHLYNYDESDFFVWEMMHGGKCGLNIGVMKMYIDIVIPYNNRKLLDLLLRVPLEKRISDQHHMDLKRYMNQELYDMNIRVVNLNQPESRAKALNIYYTVHSILPF